MSANTNSLKIAVALVGALSMAALLPASSANAAGTHSCAGQSAKDYDGGEWRAVKAGVCTEVGGKLEAFDGVGMPKDMSKKS